MKMKKCNKIIHNLKVIAVHGSDYEQEVVRWCRDCGAIVVDIDGVDFIMGEHKAT